MNKRQKKKNIKNALLRLENGECRKQDRHVLRTYGRKAFEEKHYVSLEDYEFAINSVTKTVGEVLVACKKAIKSLFRSMGETFTKLGSD